MTEGDVVRDAAGRLRVGWRLLAFGVAFFVLAATGLSLSPWEGLPAQGIVLLVAAVVAGVALLRLAEGRGPAALGFHLSREAPGEAVRGLVLGVVVALAAVGAIAAVGGVRWELEAGTAGASVAEGLRSLGYFAIPAAAEEALARGYPLQAMAAAWGSAWALVVTSVGFGLLHLGNPGLSDLAMVNLIVAGAFLGVVYLRTGSLWWASGAHLGWNWAHGFVADLPVSGLDLVDAPLWEGIPRGPAWLGGGAFGPEGSAVTAVVVLAVTATLWWGPWLRPGEAARAARPLMALPGGPGDGGRARAPDARRSTES